MKISIRFKTALKRIIVSCMGVIVLSSCSSLKKETKKPLNEIRVIFFDVNETMLDLESMRDSVGKALGNRRDLLSYWFSKMLHYSLVSTDINNYQDFGNIGVNSLLMVARENNIPLTAERAKKAIVGPLLSLPPHSDVIPALKELQKMNIKLVTLTNSSNFGVKSQLENANMIDFFDDRLSIEDIKIYKPHGSTYKWAIDKLNVTPQEAVLVAAHGWDVAGAKAAGLKAVFVSRPGKSLYPLSIQPDYVVKDFGELVKLLKSKNIPMKK
jgi:2-haloacid dehalogenase